MKTADNVPRMPINKWACHKLECFGDFIKKYAAKIEGRHYGYMALFPESEDFLHSGSGLIIKGCGSRVLSLKDMFDNYSFIVSEETEANKLKKAAGANSAALSVTIGNPISNETLLNAFDAFPRSAPVFIHIDPKGYQKLRFSTIKKLALHGRDWQMNKPDLLIMLPLEMALLRNLSRTDCEASITRFFGTNEWIDIRNRHLQGKLPQSAVRQNLLALYQKNLKKLGYKYTSAVTPAKFSNPPFYHIIWASDTSDESALIKSVWNSERYLPYEMFAKGAVN